MLEKIKKFFIGLILAALAISSCTRTVPTNNSSLDKGSTKSSKGVFGFLFKGVSTPTPPGDYVHTVDVKKEAIKEARTRSYSLHVPASYDATGAVGLLFLFPTDGETSADFMKETHFTDFTDKEGYIVVVPDQYSEGMKWNNGVTKTDGPDDLLFIKNLLASIKEDFKIDPNRVFVAGKATGGIMAYQVAATMADQVAAVGAFGSSAGFRLENGAKALMVSAPVQPISVMEIHGMRDGTVPFGTDAAAQSAAAGFITFGETESFWTSALGCGADFKAQLVKHDHIQKHLWNACNGNTSFHSIAIWTGTSQWPEGNAKLKGYSVDIPATQYIWEFLTSHPKSAQ